MTKNKMEKKEFKVVEETRVNAPESLFTIPKGTTVSVSCLEFASLNTVRSAISRLNHRAGFKEFEASSPDNGVTIVVKRNVKPAESVK